MGGFSLWHWLVVGVILLLLFGKGRFSDMMGDVAKGIKSFKKGMTEDEEAASTAQPRITSDRPAEQPTIVHPAGERTGEAAPVAPEVHPGATGERREP
jgi:sec-independent protein translocase protein TatA